MITQIVTCKSLNLLKETINSINIDSIVIELGNCTETEIWCHDNYIRFEKSNNCTNLSEVRNKFIQGKTLLLNAGEIVKTDVNDYDSATILIKDKNLLSKEIRITSEDNIKGHVFEYVDSDLYEESDIKINQMQNNNLINFKQKMSEKELSKNPLKKENLLWDAYSDLAQEKYDRFCYKAYYYLKKFDSKYLLYQLLLVRLYCYDDYDYIEKALPVLFDYKLNLAEFWCLLGDLKFKQQNYSDCINPYKIAIECGKSIDVDLNFPIDLTRYKNHPCKMIELSKNNNPSLLEI